MRRESWFESRLHHKVMSKKQEKAPQGVEAELRETNRLLRLLIEATVGAGNYEVRERILKERNNDQ